MPKLKTTPRPVISPPTSLRSNGTIGDGNSTIGKNSAIGEDLNAHNAEDESSKLLYERKNGHGHKNSVSGVKLVPANGHMNGNNAEFPRAKPMMTNGNKENSRAANNGPDLNKVSNNPAEYKRINTNRRVIGPRGVAAVGKRRYCGSYKVIAFICGMFACILLIMGLASSEWLTADGYRQGLFVYCVSKTKNGTLPATVPFLSVSDHGTERAGVGCHRLDLNFQLYTLFCAAFVLISLLVNVFSTLLTALGLRCRDPNNKYKYYRIAVYVMGVALVAILAALVIYPVCFAQILMDSKRAFWEFGWAYGVGWGASIFLFGGVILLLCDKESEEIYYKERTIVQYADSNNK